jgi:hypothetical protein
MIKRIKKLINEYITNPAIWLKNYLTMTDEQKYLDLVNRKPHDYTFYAGANDIEVPNEFDGNEYEFIDSLPKEEKLKFGEYLYDEMKYDEYEDPSWAFMDFAGVVKNQWLVHLTDSPDGIIKEGFKNGLEDFTSIAYTRRYDAERGTDKNYMYIFAYTPYDFKRFGRANRGREYKYGKDAIVFKSSGVRVLHHGDEEYQTIFMASTATDMIPVYHGGEEKEYYIEKNKNGGYEKLIEFDTIEEAITWIENNFDQYRSVIVQRAKERNESYQATASKNMNKGVVKDTDIFINPNSEEILDLYKINKNIRGLVTDNGDVYIWEGSSAIHDAVIGELDLYAIAEFQILNKKTIIWAGRLFKKESNRSRANEILDKFINLKHILRLFQFDGFYFWK